jgi:hypothetical protein
MSDEQSIPEITPDDVIEDVPDKLEHPDVIPNRARRALFVFSTWYVSFVATVAISAFAADHKLSQLAIDGLTTYMVTIAVLYIVGHTADRLGIIDKLSSIVGKKV